MLKVLIAEDEQGICNLIYSLIEWEGLGLEFLGFAMDGEQALAMMKERKPDIVITDICMPLKTGLELIRECKEIGWRSKFIIISGYSHFEYAYEAIKYGVESFLLKPINKNELNDALRDLVEKINRYYDIVSPLEKSRQRRESGRKLQRRALLTDLVYRWKELGGKTFEEMNRSYLYEFADGIFEMGIAGIDGLSALDGGFQGVVLGNVSKKLGQVFKGQCVEFEAMECGSQIVFIVNYLPGHKREMHHLYGAALGEIEQQLAPYGTLSPTLGIGLSCNNADDLGASLLAARKAFAARLLLGSRQVIRAGALNLNDPGAAADISLMQMAEFVNAYERMDEKALHKAVADIFAANLEALREYPHFVFPRMKEIAMAMLSQLHNRGLITGGITGRYAAISEKIDGSATLEEMRGRMADGFCAMLDLSNEKALSDSKTIKLAKEYIAKNYGEHIRLEDVAKKVYLSPQYLGTLFKKETGVNFSDYIVLMRIEAAKELLRDISLSVAQIADRVGYADKRYFSRLFKNCVGITPKEYRRIHHERKY